MYVKIERLFLDELKAVYRFRSVDRGGGWGECEIDRRTGEVRLLKEAEFVNEPAFGRAGRRLFLHWKEGRFPELTEWAT
ncbi:MAG: hypothetical protein LW650_04300 [Planctomycetaceae bacterium]|jgi:hypothetical protein|nr:hypothetical protein [Phycisphaerales bacterium]MCE2652728.1 hypothetical protein [Planctomycetaceae bacterium]